MVMTKDDPWCASSFGSVSQPSSSSFEDNFVSSGALPDSAEYIASLERKLERIKRGRGQLSKDLLKSLAEKRRDDIARLLTQENSISSSSQEEDLPEENVPAKWLPSYLNPERALTVGELVELLSADVLAKQTESLVKPDPTTPTSPEAGEQ